MIAAKHENVLPEGRQNHFGDGRHNRPTNLMVSCDDDVRSTVATPSKIPLSNSEVPRTAIAFAFDESVQLEPY